MEAALQDDQCWTRNLLKTILFPSSEFILWNFYTHPPSKTGFFSRMPLYCLLKIIAGPNKKHSKNATSLSCNCCFLPTGPQGCTVIKVQVSFGVFFGPEKMVSCQPPVVTGQHPGARRGFFVPSNVIYVIVIFDNSITIPKNPNPSLEWY